MDRIKCIEGLDKVVLKKDNISSMMLFAATEEDIKNITIKDDSLYPYINGDIKCKHSQILAFGEITDADISSIKKLLTNGDYKGYTLPRNYNESDHTYLPILVDNKPVMGNTETFDGSKWFNYNYNKIGKPKYIVICNVPNNQVYVKSTGRNAR